MHNDETESTTALCSCQVLYASSSFIINLGAHEAHNQARRTQNIWQILINNIHNNSQLVELDQPAASHHPFPLRIIDRSRVSFHQSGFFPDVSCRLWHSPFSSHSQHSSLLVATTIRRASSDWGWKIVSPSSLITLLVDSTRPGLHFLSAYPCVLLPPFIKNSPWSLMLMIMIGTIIVWCSCSRFVCIKKKIVSSLNSCSGHIWWLNEP